MTLFALLLLVSVPADAPVPAQRFVDTASRSVFLSPQEDALWGRIEISGAAAPSEVASSVDGVSFTPVRTTIAREGGRILLRFGSLEAKMLRIRFPEGAQVPTEIRLFRARREAVVVSNVRIVPGEATATVSWRTNIPDASNVYYSPRGWGRERLRHAGGEVAERTTEHRVDLAGLLPGTEYQVYLQTGEDLQGTVARGQQPTAYRFKTLGTPYPFPTRFVLVPGVETALVEVTTNVPCRVQIELPGVPSAVSPTSPLGTRHRILLSGLPPRTDLAYRVVCTDARDRTMEQPPGAFRTRGNNLAFRRPVRGSFTALLVPDQLRGDTPPLRRITDGKNDYFTGMATSGNPSETVQWAEVDLGAARALGSIEIVWRGNAYPNQFFVMTSSDGTNWAYPTVALSAGEGSFERSSAGDPLQRVVISMTEFPPARYLKVFIPQGAPIHVRSEDWRFVQLAEIEAYPPATAAGASGR